MKTYLRLLICAGFLLLPGLVRAQPPGRAWAPSQPPALPVTGLHGSPALISNPAGIPALLVAGRRYQENADRWAVFAWTDTAWAESLWSSESYLLGAEPEFVAASSADIQFTSLAYDKNPPYHLMLWTINGAISPAETISVGSPYGGRPGWAAAVSGRRRWACRTEQPVNVDSTYVIPYFSDLPGTWNALPRVGVSEYNCSIASLNDSTAILMYSGDFGTWLTRIEGNQWGPPTHFFHRAKGLHFLARPGGGWWLISTGGRNVQVDAFDGATWTSELDYPGVHSNATYGWVSGCEFSRGGPGRPALAWIEGWDDGMGHWREDAHVAWPAGNGWSGAYAIPGATGSLVLWVSVALDRNEDVWLISNTDYVISWTHSYVSAVPSAPDLQPLGTSSVRVGWTLSQSAPGTWWAVLRDSGDDHVESVSRIRAGEDTQLFWDDDGPPHPASNVLRYRIRRESVDRRYEFVTAPTTFDLATPVRPEIVRAIARTDGVSLQGHVAVPGVELVLERRSDVSDWQLLARLRADGSGDASYVDHAILGGQRYAYRLEQGLSLSPEVWVEVPLALFALEGLRPNPGTAGDLHVAFSLELAGPVELEMVDVGGRRVLSLGPTSLDAGSHLLDLPGTVPAGIYWVRLRERDRVAMARAIVLR